MLILSPKTGDHHCVKSVQMRSFFRSFFSCIRTEYGDLLCKSPYSVRIQENTVQKKLRIWTLFTQCIAYLIVDLIGDDYLWAHVLCIDNDQWFYSRLWQWSILRSTWLYVKLLPMFLLKTNTCLCLHKSNANLWENVLRINNEQTTVCLYNIAI